MAKKKQNINMKVGNTMFRNVEQMDDSGLTKVALALLNEMQQIELSMQGNANQATKSLLMSRADTIRKHMQRVEQYKRNLENKKKVT